jgi:hypothetical protein
MIQSQNRSGNHSGNRSPNGSTIDSQDRHPRYFPISLAYSLFCILLIYKLLCDATDYWQRGRRDALRFVPAFEVVGVSGRHWVAEQESMSGQANSRNLVD